MTATPVRDFRRFLKGYILRSVNILLGRAGLVIAALGIMPFVWMVSTSFK